MSRRPGRKGARACGDRDRLLDHLLTLLAFQARFDLDVLASGDLEIDEHHTTEDVLAATGEALNEALGAREGTARYGDATVPMDEATGAAAVNLVRRPHAEVESRAPGHAARARARAVRDAGAGDRARARHRHRRAPRRRGSLQGARPGAQRRMRPLRRRCRLDEGPRVRVVLADYGAATSAALHRHSPRRRRARRQRRSHRRARGAARRDRRRRQRCERRCGLTPVAAALLNRVAAGRPLLGICVGLQLLFEESDEGRSRPWASSEDAFAGYRPRPCRTWAGTTSRRRERPRSSTASMARTSTSRTATQRNRRTTSRRRSSSTAARGRCRVRRRRRRPVPPRAERRGRSPLPRECPATVKKRLIPCLDVAAGGW